MRLYDFLDKTVIKENVEGLNIGDEVEITGNVQFAGATGVIDNFGKDKRFVIVNLYNHGRHSFHSSDVSFNDYADSDNEEADMYDRDEDFRRSMSNEHIAKVKGGYRLLSKHGNKNLGTYPTRAGAEKRERQVQYFKHAGESVESGVAEGAPELLKKEMPLHRHAEKLLAQNGVSKDDPDYHHHLNNTIKHLRQFGNIDLINKSDEQGVAEAFQNDEANLFYRYDTADGRLKQKMIDNLDEPKAFAQGYRDSVDGALRVAGIIRSKFDPKKFVQKQSNGWVAVYPFGKQETKEASDISGLLSASKLNNVFVVKTDTKSYKVKAQSARVASEKVSKAHPEAKIVSVKDVTNTK